jgi:hypothetical protein
LFFVGASFRACPDAAFFCSKIYSINEYKNWQINNKQNIKESGGLKYGSKLYYEYKRLPPKSMDKLNGNGKRL